MAMPARARACRRPGCTPLTDTPCESDANPCTNDVCQNGVCHHPSPCDGTNDPPCRAGTCDPQQGCVFDDLPDGTNCAANGCTMHVCEAGQCVTECDDSDPCTSDSCGTSFCLNEEQPDFCPCTSGGNPLPAGTRCVDGNQCTHPDACNGGGLCVGGPTEDDGNPCTVELDQGGICGHLDGFVCPINCSGVADGTLCSDLNACTTGICQGQTCVSTPITCDEPSCGGTETCQPFTGCQQVTFGDACEDDGNPCTEGRCDPELGCVQDPLTGTPCGSDADVCTTDVCNAGTCTHPPVACDDHVSCTVDACGDPAGCTHAPDDAACDDGDPCTDDACDATAGCQHVPVDCDDGDACTADSCNASGVCEHADACAVDDFKCYRAKKTPGTSTPLPVAGVAVEDAFGSLTVDVKKGTALCAPASTDGGDPSAPSHAGHLAGYQIKAAAGSPKFARRTGLHVTNALGTLVVDARTRQTLLAPSAKSLTAPPGDLVPPTPDDYECYGVKVSPGTQPFQPIASAHARRSVRRRDRRREEAAPALQPGERRRPRSDRAEPCDAAPLLPDQGGLRDGQAPEDRQRAREEPVRRPDARPDRIARALPAVDGGAVASTRARRVMRNPGSGTGGTGAAAAGRKRASRPAASAGVTDSACGCRSRKPPAVRRGS